LESLAMTPLEVVGVEVEAANMESAIVEIKRGQRRHSPRSSRRAIIARPVSSE